MKIIYCHHAERDVDPRKLRSQDDDLTDNGIKDAELVSELLANQKINAIYTSTFYRCKKTAQIINRTLNIPIVEEERFNEVGSVEGEEWKNALQRNIDAIVNIQEKFNDDATILCITSGINLSAFVCWNLKLKPNKYFPFMGASNCSPITFYAPSLIEFRERKFFRGLNVLKEKKNKDYKIVAPTKGELKSAILFELKAKTEQMEMFTNKLRREEYLSNRLAIDIMQLIKDYCLCEEIPFDSVRTETALKLNEEQCIKNIVTYTERLFYLDINIQETLMLIYSTLVSYINYNDLIYNDIERTCVIVEEEEGSYYNGKYLYKLR